MEVLSGDSVRWVGAAGRWARPGTGLDARRHRHILRRCEGGVERTPTDEGHDAARVVAEHAVVELAEVVAVLTLLHDENRAMGVVDHAVGDAPEQELLEAAQAPAAQHD